MPFVAGCGPRGPENHRYLPQITAGPGAAGPPDGALDHAQASVSCRLQPDPGRFRPGGAGGKAGFRVCNRSGQQIDVAFGRPGKTSGWTAEGWWSIPRGQCPAIATEALTDRYFYLYAIGSKGGVWQATGTQKGGHFCIRRNRFVLRNCDHIRNGVLDCAVHHLMSRQFFVVDTGGAPDHTHDLKD